VRWPCCAIIHEDMGVFGILGRAHKASRSKLPLWRRHCRHVSL
jgi:hypothetical protein